MPELYNNVRRANSQYVPQFIGSNAESIKSVSDVLQTRSLQNQNAIDDSLVRVLNEKYAPGDEHIGQGIYEDVNKLREELASSDQGFENSTGIIRNAVRDKVLTNRDRIEGLRNSQEWDKYQEQLRTLGADAVDFTPEWKGTKNSDGSYNRLIPKVEKRLDYDKQKEQFYNQFEADLTQGRYKEGEGSLKDFLVSSISGGIDPTKVNEYANAALNRYSKTSEYDQEFRVRQKQNPDATKEQIDADIRQSIIDTGLERVHKISKQDLQRLYQLKENPEDKSPATPIFSGTRSGAVVDNDVNKPTTTDIADSKNVVLENGRAVQYINKKTGEPLNNSDNPILSSATDAQAIEFFNNNYRKVDLGDEATYNRTLNDELSQSYDRVKDLKGFDGKSPLFKDFTHYKASVKAANVNSAKVTPVGYEIAPEQAGNYNAYVNSDASLPMYLNGRAEPIDLNTYAKEIGASPSDIKFNVSKVFFDSPTTRLPGGYVEARIVVNDSKVKEHESTVRIPLNFEAQALASNIDTVFKNSLYSGVDTFTQEQPFQPTDVKGNPLQDKQGNRLAIWTTTIPLPAEMQQSGRYPRRTIVHKGIITPDGNVIHEEDMDINQYKEQMNAILAPSLMNVLNAGTTFNITDAKQRGLGN